jgi:hypothetical protein
MSRYHSICNMNRTWGWQKLAATRINAARWVSSCCTPSQHLLSTFQGIKLFHNYGFIRAAAHSPCKIIFFINTGPGVSIVEYKESTVYEDSILPCVRVDILNGTWLDSKSYRKWYRRRDPDLFGSTFFLLNPVQDLWDRETLHGLDLLIYWACFLFYQH